MLKLEPQEMLIFQIEVCYEKSFHYRDFLLFHNVQGFITFRLCFHIMIRTEIFGYSPGFKVK